MKKIILSITLLSSILSADFLTDMNGLWFVSSIDGRKGTVFGNDIESKRGSKLTIEIKGNNILVQENGTLYNSLFIKDKLYLSKSKIDMENLNNVDILKESGKYKGCTVLKYIKKGLKGYYRKEGYKICKIK